MTIQLLQVYLERMVRDTAAKMNLEPIPWLKIPHSLGIKFTFHLDKTALRMRIKQIAGASRISDGIDPKLAMQTMLDEVRATWRAARKSRNYYLPEESRAYVYYDERQRVTTICFKMFFVVLPRNKWRKKLVLARRTAYKYTKKFWTTAADPSVNKITTRISCTLCYQEFASHEDWKHHRCSSPNPVPHNAKNTPTS